MIVALVTDLIFATKISYTAQAVGATLKTVRSLEKLQEQLATGEVRLVVIDLSVESVDVMQAIAVCRGHQPPPHIIAYASHVQADVIHAARTAGADQVMARSSFAAKLPALLETAAHDS